MMFIIALIGGASGVDAGGVASLAAADDDDNVAADAAVDDDVSVLLNAFITKPLTLSNSESS